MFITASPYFSQVEVEVGRSTYIIIKYTYVCLNLALSIRH